MSNLVINTPEGEDTQRKEKRAVRLFHARFPDRKFIDTHGPNGAAAPIDGCIERSGSMTSVVEVKARDCTREEMEYKYSDRWLLSFSKVRNGITLTEIYLVPFFGFCYLVPDDLLLIIPLWMPRGREREPTARFYVETTKTQDTIYGGEKWEPNAFIELRLAREVSGKALGVPGTWEDEVL